MSIKRSVLAVVAALSAVSAETRAESGDGPLPKTGNTVARTHKTHLAFPRQGELKGTDYAAWHTPLQFRRDEPKDLEFSPVTSCARGESPYLHFVVGNFGSGVEELENVRYEIFDACGRTKFAQTVGFSRRMEYKSGKCGHVKSRLPVVKELEPGKYVFRVTLNPQAVAAKPNLCTTTARTLVIVGENRSVPESGMQFYTLYDRMRTGLPVANCLVPDGYVMGGRAKASSERGSPDRFFLTAYDPTSWSQMTVGLSHRIGSVCKNLPIAKAAAELEKKPLSVQFEKELLAQYGFGAATSKTSVSEDLKDVPEARFRERQAIARRDGRTCTAVKEGRCRVTLHAERNGARFAVYGDIPFLLEEFDGGRTEVLAVSVNSFCTEAGGGREEDMKSQLADFAKTIMVCPLFESGATLPDRDVSDAERESVRALGALFDEAMKLNNLDADAFKPWKNKIANLHLVAGSQGRRHLVSSRFRHCGVNLRTGEALYWNPGFVGVGFDPGGDPRMNAQRWDLCNRKD